MGSPFWIGNVGQIDRPFAILSQNLAFGDSPLGLEVIQIVNEKDIFRNFAEPESRKSLKKQADIFAGKDSSTLWAVSAKNGTKLKEIELNVTPIFDGLIAANGKLYMSTTDGKIISLK